MRPAELAFRGRQEAGKFIGRLMAAAWEPTPRVRLDRTTTDAEMQAIHALLKSGPGGEAARRLRLRFNEAAPARFFAGASEAGFEAMMDETCPTHREVILGEAEAICRGKFAILGYGRLSFGLPVDWHIDPVAKRQSPRLHWSRIDPLDTAMVGDSKVVWELNRHQWLTDLGQAYRFTGNERYARTAMRLLRSWMADNPPGIGINWSSAIEVAMRLMAWCWALFMFRDAEAMTDEVFLEMLGWMQVHASFVERNLSYYYSPNTHLTAEALGLYYAGSLLQELDGASRWRQLGERVLVEQMTRQVHADGVYFEQSTRYQYYTIEIYLHFLILAQRNKDRIEPEVARQLKHMVTFLLCVRQPDGLMPRIGDADGGWLLPFAPRGPDDAQALFSTAALFYGNEGFAWAAGELAPESMWLLGKRAQQTWQSLTPRPPPLNEMQEFGEGGYVVQRSGWDSDANHLILDTGPLGCGVSGGHGHADLLSIQCSAYGMPCLVDAGTYCYTRDPLWRDYFRSTQAHNTVLVDGRSQARPRGPFSWHEMPVATPGPHFSRDGLSCCEGSHRAWQDDPSGMVHRRRVVFVAAQYWLLIDDIEGNADHAVELRLQCAPLPVSREGEWVRVRGSRSALLMKTFTTASLSSVITTGALDPVCGWISPAYGQRLAAPMLRVQARGALPLRLVTLLYPVRDPGEAPPATSVIESGGHVSGLTLHTPTPTRIEFGEHDVQLVS